MIEFHREFIGCHHLKDVIVEDWDGNGTEDIRVIYSEYTDYHYRINEAVFSLKNNRLVPLFFITTDDKLYHEEYPEKAPYYRREYKKTKSGVLIHEYDGTINLNRKSPDYNKITHISDKTYEEALVNKDLEITDIYCYEEETEDSYYEEEINITAFKEYDFVDENGVELLPFKYDYAHNFSERLAAVELNEKWGFIDKTGKEVIPLKYDYAHNFSEGLSAVELNGKWGFIDKTGKEVIPLKYDGVSALFCDGFWEGLAAVELNGKWGFINKTGEEVIPFRYDFTWGFGEGLAPVELNGKWGYIDRYGKQIIPFRYDEAYCFSKNIAKVGLNGKFFNINKKGNNVD
jgi:hypothetical protein